MSGVKISENPPGSPSQKTFRVTDPLFQSGFLKSEQDGGIFKKPPFAKGVADPECPEHFFAKDQRRGGGGIFAKGNLFPYLLLLTALFLFLELGFFIQWIHYYLGDYQVVAHHLSVPKAAIPGIVYFIFILFALHFLYAVVVWLTARLFGVAFKLSWNKVEKIGFKLWSVGLIIILLANQYFFPNSKFSYVVSIIIPPQKGLILFITLSFLLLAIFSVAVFKLFRFSPMLIIVVIVSSVVWNAFGNHGPIVRYFAAHFLQKSVPSVPDKPNIILIGIDSLRPDFLGYFNPHSQSFSQQKAFRITPTPHIDDFLNQAHVYPHAVTPLARTFPAWVSILTGQYPNHSGIRTNLSDQTKLNFSNTLPAILRKQGYNTIFATDESRFSNIDRRFGFNQVIAPPMGFNDFLLGTLNDFPFSNLIINTRLGAYLFPYSYANRGVFTAYDPNTFLTTLEATLSQRQQQPLFLAVHFCLPHFPYFWGENIANNRSILNYQSAIERVDRQFNDFLAILLANKLLDHSIVILLSDHGEALELPGDRVTEVNSFVAGLNNKSKTAPHFYPPSMETESINQSAGHGTDVLGLAQHHILLAFRFYNYPHSPLILPAQNPSLSLGKGSANWVSLLDIKPTLLSLLGNRIEMMDGRSLVNQKGIQRDLFIESDFSPKAVRSIHPETQKVLFEGMDYFRIDPVTTRIIVKKDMMKLILSSKQYADLYQNWILALYPQNENEMMPILVNLKTGEWTNDLQTPFAANSPAKHMLSALKSFYGNDITKVLVP